VEYSVGYRGTELVGRYYTMAHSVSCIPASFISKENSQAEGSILAQNLHYAIISQDFVKCLQNEAAPEVPPDYVPDVMRELTTSLDVYSGGGGIAEAGGIHVAANAAGVRYPKALCGRR